MIEEIFAKLDEVGINFTKFIQQKKSWKQIINETKENATGNVVLSRTDLSILLNAGYCFITLLNNNVLRQNLEQIISLKTAFMHSIEITDMLKGYSMIISKEKDFSNSDDWYLWIFKEQKDLDSTEDLTSLIDGWTPQIFKDQQLIGGYQSCIIGENEYIFEIQENPSRIIVIELNEKNTDCHARKLQEDLNAIMREKLREMNTDLLDKLDKGFGIVSEMIKEAKKDL